MPSTGWQDYVDNSLMGSGYVSQAGIYSLESGHTWASSSGFNVSSSEVKALIRGFVDPDALHSKGILLGGVKFTCSKTDKDYLIGMNNEYADKHEQTSALNNYGRRCVVYKCKRCLIVIVCADSSHASHGIPLVMKLGAYLKDIGY